MVTVDRIHGRNDPGRINAGRNPAPGRPGPDPVRTGPIRVGRAPTRAALHRALPGTTQPGQRSTELCPGRPPTRAALHRALPGTTQPGQRSTELCPERPRPRASWDAEFYTYPPARIGGTHNSTERCPGRGPADPDRASSNRIGRTVGRSDGPLCPGRPRPGPPGKPNFTPIHRPASGAHSSTERCPGRRAVPCTALQTLLFQ